MSSVKPNKRGALFGGPASRFARSPPSRQSRQNPSFPFVYACQLGNTDFCHYTIHFTSTPGKPPRSCPKPRLCGVVGTRYTGQIGLVQSRNTRSARKSHRVSVACFVVLKLLPRLASQMATRQRVSIPCRKKNAVNRKTDGDRALHGGGGRIPRKETGPRHAASQFLLLDTCRRIRRRLRRRLRSSSWRRRNRAP